MSSSLLQQSQVKLKPVLPNVALSCSASCTFCHLVPGWDSLGHLDRKLEKKIKLIVCDVFSENELWLKITLRPTLCRI